MDKRQIMVLNQGGQRLRWVDALKGIAILTVVLGHVLLGYAENNAFPEPAHSIIYGIKLWIYTWHMPLFFVISGFTFTSAYLSSETGVISIQEKRLKNQLLNLILIFLIFQISLCVLKMIFSSFVDNPMSFKEMVFNIFIPNTIMWYIWVLVVFYLAFSYLCRTIKIIDNRRFTIVFIILLLIGIFEKITATVLNYRLCIGNLLHCAAFFWLGIYFSRIGIERNKRYNFIVVSSLIIVIVYALVFAIRYPISSNENIIYVLFGEINALAIIIILIGIFNRVKINDTLLTKIGEKSLCIYLLHTYFVTALKVMFIRIGLCTTNRALLIVLITWFIPSLVSFGIAILSYKILLLKIIFNPITLFNKVGIKYQRKSF